jgi:hypothetical protein
MFVSKIKSWFRATPTGAAEIAVRSGEPSLAEIVLMFVVVFGVHLVVISSTVP